jgi:hypothetical protein
MNNISKNTYHILIKNIDQKTIIKEIKGKGKGKDKCKVHPRTGYEGQQGE